MDITYVKDIKIIYDEELNKNIKEIKNIIENNYNTIITDLTNNNKNSISLIYTENENELYIENFDIYFLNIIKKFYYTENNIKLLNSLNFKKNLYTEILIRTKQLKQILYIENKKISNETIYNLLGIYNYLIDKDENKFIEFIKTKNNIEEKIKPLRNEIGILVYNDLLKQIINHLSKEESNMLKQLNNILTISQNDLYSIKNNHYINSQISFSKLSKKELYTLFYNFLKKINAPTKWYKIFEDALINNNIKFTNQSICKQDMKIIELQKPINIETFIDLVHEFIHYIEKPSTNNISYSLMEFSSIYFENLAINYLDHLDYNKQIIDKLKETRQKNNNEIIINLLSLFTDISIIYNKGTITKNDKIKFWQKQFNEVQKLEENLTLTEKETTILKNIDIKEEVEKEIENSIINIIEKGITIIDGIQYLFGTYLSNEISKNGIDDFSCINKMIFISENLKDYTLKEIIEIFNISLDDGSKTDKESNKKLQKK